MKKIRRFLGIILSMFLLINLRVNVMAQENNQEVLLTEEMALNLASNYAAIFTDKELVPCNPTKLYETDGQAIGYIIELYYRGAPYGYLVFDNNVEGLLAEISLNNDGDTPQEELLEKFPSKVREKKRMEKVYKLDTAIYGIATDNYNEFITNYNDVVEVSNIKSERSSKPTSWEDVSIDKKYDTKDIYISSMGHLPEFIAYDETTVEQTTQHYACLISAAMVCATYYGCADYSTLASDYMTLWNLTGTTVSHTKDGITYGETNPANGVNGLKNFCAQKGIVITSSDIWNPTLPFYRTAINRGDIGMVHCGISLSDGRSGHTMAVEGYAQIIVNNTTFNTAMVSDGWDNGVYYLNLDTSQYSDLKGTVFKL